MSTFTSTLPDELLNLLAERAVKLKMPKNKIIEKALRIYLEQLNKAEYVKSYRLASDDSDILSIAEEGVEDYFNQLKG